MRKKTGIILMLVVLFLTILQPVAMAVPPEKTDGVYVSWFYCGDDSFLGLLSCLGWMIGHGIGYSYDIMV